MPSGISPESLKRALSLIRKSKSDIYAICQSKYLSRDAVEDIILFLDTFFDNIQDNNEMPQLLKMPEVD
jgi:hypothetical protein